MYAPSYRSLATHAAGEVAKKAEAEKEEKYHDLLHSHGFTPVTVETSGVFGPKTMSFVKEVGKRLRSQSGERKETSYLIQRLSMAVQRGNAVCILEEMMTPLPSLPTRVLQPS